MCGTRNILHSIPGYSPHIWIWIHTTFVSQNIVMNLNNIMHVVIFINSRYIPYIPLECSVNFPKPWTSTGCFPNSTGSSMTSGWLVLSVHCSSLLPSSGSLPWPIYSWNTTCPSWLITYSNLTERASKTLSLDRWMSNFSHKTLYKWKIKWNENEANKQKKQIN